MCHTRLIRYIVSISLDPGRDTPETLKVFGQKLRVGSGWRLLTGDQQSTNLYFHQSCAPV